MNGKANGWAFSERTHTRTHHENEGTHTKDITNTNILHNVNKSGHKEEVGNDKTLFKSTWVDEGVHACNSRVLLRGLLQIIPANANHSIGVLS